MSEPILTDHAEDLPSGQKDTMSLRIIMSTAALLLGISAIASEKPSAVTPSAAPAIEVGTTPGSGTSSPLAPSEREAQARLEAAGFTDVRNVKSGPEGISAKAMKDGKEVAVVVDSSGTIKERSVLH
jgi:hypothetical protein